MDVSTDCTMDMTGHLIAFEGLDQSGKQTQAELLRDRLKQDGRKARLVSFPDYGTSIGEEIARALQGEREYGADVMQLLYVANRYERKPDLQRWLDGGLILVCDRYMASSIAYGEAQGLDPAWLADMQKLPAAADADDPARHRAGDRRPAQGGRPRSLRARPRAAGARARELPPPGRRRRLGRARRRADQGGDRRRRVQRRDVTTRAAVSARTSVAPRRFQHPRARIQRRAGRAHIVHQHDDRSAHCAGRAGVAARTHRGRCGAAARRADRSASRRAPPLERRAHRQPRCRARSAA